MNFLVTFLLSLFVAFILVTSVFMFREIYRHARLPACPYCGERKGVMEADDEDLVFCSFCGSTWKPR
jgi:hypothetical protein